MRAVIETCYLQPAAWRLAARLAQAAGCDGVVCATGLGPEGATPAAIEALRAELPPEASSRRRAASASLADAQRALGAGADLLGVADPAGLLAELAEAAPARRRRPAAGRLRAVGDLPSWAAWLLVALVLLGAEALTLHSCSSTSALGALVATAVAPFVGTAGQGLVFAVSSVLLMVLTRRPLIAWSGRQRGGDERRDSHGRSAVVTITVDNHANTGQVRIGGEYWTARTPSDDDPPIAPGVVVRIESVAGVTVRVVPREAGVSIPREYQ